MSQGTEQYFNAGVIKDFAVQPANTLKDLWNMTLVSNDNNTYAIEDMDGNSFIFAVTKNYRPIGWAKTANIAPGAGYLRIYSAYVGNLPVNNGEIGQVLIDNSNVAVYRGQYNHPGVNLTLEHQIEGLVFPENENIERSYITDNFNPPMAFNHNDSTFNDAIPSGTLINGKTYMVLNGVINYNGILYGPDDSTGQITTFTANATSTFIPVSGSPNIINYVPYESLSWSPIFKMGNIGFKQWIVGQKRFGKWQYLYQLGTADGVLTKFSYATRPILIGENNPGTGVPLNNYTGMRGGYSSANSTMGIRLEIKNIDPIYTRIRVVAVHNIGYNIDDTPGVIFDGDITGTTMIIDDVGTVPLAPLLLDDLIAIKPFLKTVKTLTTTDNILFIGNIRTSLSFTFDTTGIVANCIQHLFPADMIDQRNFPSYNSPVQALYRSDEITASGYILPEMWYQVFGSAGNTLTYPGTGLTYNPGDVFQAVAGFRTYTTFGAATIKPVLRIFKYSTKIEHIPYENDYMDYKGLTASTYIQSLWRNETYRTGIVFYDTIGNPFYVDHITDKVIPPMHAQAGYVQDNGNPLGFTAALSEQPGGGLMNQPNGGYQALKSIGLRFSNINFNNLTDALTKLTGTPIALTDLPKYVSGFSIVRAKRDATIMSQGMLFPVVYGYDAPDLTIHPSGAIPYVYDQNYRDSKAAASIYGRRRNKYVYYSPDINFRFQDKPKIQSGDYAEIEGYLSEIHGGQAWGTSNTLGWDFHNKLYGTDSDSGAKAFGSKGAIGLPAPYLDTGSDVQWDIDVFENSMYTVSGYAGISLDAFSVGARSQLFFIDGNEGAAGDVNEPGFGSFSEYDWRRPLVNVVRPKEALYGGQDKSALAATQYISTGHYQAMDTDFINYLQSNGGIADDIDVYGGDCYLGIFSLERALRDQDPGTPQVTFGLCFPCESNVNVALRGYDSQVRYFAKDRAWNPANTSGVSYGGPVQLENWTYNEAYSTDDGGLTYQGRPSIFLPTDRFPYMIRYSPYKNAGEIIDNFRNFQINDFKNVNGWAGEINNLRAKRMRLFYWQNEAVGTIPVNERTQISNAIGEPIVLGQGGVATRYDERTNFYGNQHQWGLVDTEDGFCWYDFRRQSFCYMNTGTEIIPLNIAKGLMSFFANTIEGDVIAENDNPLNGKGIAAGYEPRFKRVWMTFKGLGTDDATMRSRDFTAFFNVKDQIFAGFQEIAPGMMIEFNQKFLTVSPEVYPGIAALKAYVVGDKVTESNDNYICILPYTTPAVPVQPSGDPAHWFKTSSINEVYIHNTNDVGKFYNIVYNGKVTFVVNGEIELEKIFENQRWSVRSKEDAFFSKITAKTTSEQGTDIDILASANPEYEYRNKGWVSNVPLDDVTGQRMQDYFLEVECIKDNRLNGSPVDSSNKKLILVSVKTWYRQAF